MFSRWIPSLAVGTGLLLVACSPGKLAPAEETAQARTQTAEVPEGAQPIPVQSNYKDERKRIALRGLDYSSGRLEVVADEAAELVDGLDSELAVAEIERGRALLARNKRLDSIAAFTRAVLSDPDNAQAYVALGEGLLARRWSDKAVAAFRSGVERVPGSAELHFRLGEALWRTSEHEESVDELRQALALEPDHARAHERMAVFSYYRREYDQAWSFVHSAEALGKPVPPQLVGLLEGHLSDPGK